MYDTKLKVEQIENLLFFLNHMNEKISQKEIIIYDLNTNYINSGFTKIYAALNENFIIYDGRVGAALCYLIKRHLNDKTSIPYELIFGWGKGQGKKNRTVIYFEDITKNRELHFISNIKANWLLELIAKQVDIIPIKEKQNVCELKEQKDKVFALQSALFMLGEDLPRN